MPKNPYVKCKYRKLENKNVIIFIICTIIIKLKQILMESTIEIRKEFKEFRQQHQNILELQNNQIKTINLTWASTPRA